MMLDLPTFLSVIIPLFVGGLYVAGQALVTRTQVHNLEKKVNENNANIKAEIEKVKIDEAGSRIALTEALSRLNSILNEFKVQFSEAKSMYNRQDEILGELKDGFVEFKKEVSERINDLKDEVENLKNAPRVKGLARKG